MIPTNNEEAAKIQSSRAIMGGDVMAIGEVLGGYVSACTGNRGAEFCSQLYLNEGFAFI